MAVTVLGPLHVSNGRIVDESGHDFQIRGVTWGGAYVQHVPNGLEVANVREIARTTKNLGFNLVHIPFAMETLRANPIVSPKAVGANPDMFGRHALDVLDDIIKVLQDEGLFVWLENHIMDADWCCEKHDCNGAWFNERYSVTDIIALWRSFASRLATHSAVVGVSIMNEPRPLCTGLVDGVGVWSGITNRTEGCNSSLSIFSHFPQFTSWEHIPDCVQPTNSQLYAALARIGQVILHANSKLLLGLPGYDFSSRLGNITDFVRHLPASHVVFLLHEYEFFWAYLDSYVEETEVNWGYLVRQNVAPVIVSEVGWSTACRREHHCSNWMRLFFDYIHDLGGINSFYWELSPTQVPSRTNNWEYGYPEDFGILDYDWKSIYNADKSTELQGLHYGLHWTRRKADDSRIVIDASANAGSLAFIPCMLLIAMACIILWRRAPWNQDTYILIGSAE